MIRDSDLLLVKGKRFHFQFPLFRTKDIHNEKIFRVRYEEQSELDQLRANLCQSQADLRNV